MTPKVGEVYDGGKRLVFHAFLADAMFMEIVFSVTQENDGGFVAECLSLTFPSRRPCACTWCETNFWPAHETATGPQRR